VSGVSRRQAEPIFIAEFTTPTEADEVWTRLTEAGVPSAVVSAAPPWGRPVHRVQVARRDAPAALRIIRGEEA